MLLNFRICSNRCLRRSRVFERSDTKNSFERDKFYQIPQSQHFLPSQANFVFVKTSRSQALYDALLNVGCITRLFLTVLELLLVYQNKIIR